MPACNRALAPRLHPGIAIPAWTLAILALAGCDSEKDAPPASMVEQIRITLSLPISLDDGPSRVLARPSLISTGRDGEIIIGDRSDKDIKIYSPSGERLRTVGRAGEGPGEFMSLMGAQSYGDSLAAYDFLLKRLTIFSPSGKAVRVMTVDPPAFAMRVVDDTLFLFIRHPGQDGNLLHLVGRDGRTVAEFFDSRHTFRETPLRQLSATFADGANGHVFAGVFGKDSVYAFDYSGRQLAAGRIPASSVMESMNSAYARAGHRQRLSDGRWFHDGINVLLSLVALRDGKAALLVAPYDTKVGTDILEGGELIVLAPNGGRLVGVARQAVQAGLLGRDRQGAAMFLRYRDESASRIDLVRASLP